MTQPNQPKASVAGGSRERNPLIALAFMSLCLSVAIPMVSSAQVVGADVEVYGTTDTGGVDQGLIILSNAGTTNFDLYVDPGDQVSGTRDACVECNACEGECTACNYCDEGTSDPLFGTPCLAAPDGGDGDELCALDVEILLTGNSRVASFSPNPTLCASTVNTAYYPTEFDSTALSLRFNMLCGLDAMPAGINRLGSFGVEVEELDEGDVVTVSVSGTAAVGANRQMRDVSTELIAAPEPGFGIGLWVGGLCAVARRRRGARRTHAP